ncbi:zinc-dependent metalloprotease [Phytoactinopolyspora halotolerans]|uniref:Zinc-dependent metalloprotease n=1 Tax=Phytoactinopolyspora halotolerans TaxID=1981512 RepID=A0A6L9SG82_9ACTN|nr:zinc-dependent metalloprotease [Phytoactinopolyspora halotolerans]NEE04143.1 zinc-dependent metalloprotease [Phytoactinopolyspora halotolerans]
MSDVPFGFRSDDDDDDKKPEQGSGGGSGGAGGTDPLSSLFGMMGGQQGGADLGQMLQQIGKMLSWSGGPVNWDLANSAARDVVSAGGDRSVSGSERREVDDAFRLAETWLDDATSFPATGGTPRAWSRAEWVEGTQASWRGLVEPVAAKVADAMSQSLPPEMAQAAGPLVGMLQQVGVSMWGAQVGQSIGKLAGEVCGASDIGVPLAEGHPALLPANVRAFGEGLGVEPRDVTLYLALREAAYVRLYAHAPWLRSHIISLVEEYARHVNVDTDSIESKLRDIDPANPQALQEAMEGGLFDIPTSDEQKAALERLELALALVEGWVDDVVTQATDGRLPSASALRETVRRRRAAGGPAEHTFATLVGLQLRPRKLREAATFWATTREARGVTGRDAIWAHPDLMPSAEDLADPAAFLERDTVVDVSELEDALRSADAQAADDDGPETSQDDSGDTPDEGDEQHGDDR